jgi:hypothetical protein
MHLTTPVLVHLDVNCDSHGPWHGSICGLRIIDSPEVVLPQRPARRHHVVSKFYLRGFADETERITRHPLAPGSTSLAIGIGDATVSKDFYRVAAVGVEPDVFEVALGKLEAETAPAFARLIAGRTEMSNDDRYLIAIWVALQHLRSESTRRAGGELYRAFGKLEVGIFTTRQVRERL